MGDEIVILDKVFFDTAKATIKKVSFNLLEQVAPTLRAHHEITKVRIEGHTDAQGKREKNMKLSQDRADSVGAPRLDRRRRRQPPRGEGLRPDRPVADNKTSKGREANRRVEFLIIERAPAPDAAPAGQTAPAVPTSPPAKTPSSASPSGSPSG